VTRKKLTYSVTCSMCMITSTLVLPTLAPKLRRKMIGSESSTKIAPVRGLPSYTVDYCGLLLITGPALLNDQIAREKLHRFDHERIPERVVHARGAGAFGSFQVYESAEDVTHAKVLTDTSRTTPVFMRFSTVQGSRGSADTVRDVRGFAIKFYTEEGNWDIVGNDIPVFFIQDSIKFPDIGMTRSLMPRTLYSLP
jgi:catalase